MRSADIDTLKVGDKIWIAQLSDWKQPICSGNPPIKCEVVEKDVTIDYVSHSDESPTIITMNCIKLRKVGKTKAGIKFPSFIVSKTSHRLICKAGFLGCLPEGQEVVSNIIADWLDENGESDAANKIREQWRMP